MESPVDYFLLIDSELRHLEFEVRQNDQIIRNFDELLDLGLMILEDPQRLRNTMLSEREKSQTAMNNRVNILLGNSSLET
jgi:hypothetical protein